MVKRYKEGHDVMKKGPIHQEDTIIINIYVPNFISSENIKQNLTELKGKTDHNTVIVGDFNNPLSKMN